ncbi:hypothetical protein LY78DRAFT_570657 [Colletotrichum sublineola]|nr:hypothetical protein LY78DRAFT_570657 [Colletotrichum sublineola]
MHQPEGRKYQLFPKDRQQRPAPKGLDPEQAFALAMGQNEKTEKPCSSSGSLRLRIKEHNLIRRRKVSIPELGPMTTVQEVPMDSPTIPGRPPLHERSASAPGHHLKQHKSNGSFTSTAADINMSTYTTPACSPERHQRSTLETQTPRPLASPKQLAPLVIPTHIGNVPSLTKQVSNSRMRSGSSGYDTAQLSARTDDSPRSQSRTPYTPLTASTALTTPLSACHSIQSATTPASAPIMEGRDSPMPWENNSTPTATVSSSCNHDASSGPETSYAFRPYLNTHKRGQSESGSIMDRGRPRKRSDVRNNNGPLKRSCSTRNKSAERRAFEELPTGWRADEAASHMEQDELAALQTQAFGQASRFEVLRKEDVEALSKELRQLDERTEYLRRTYNSLRAGRRNLHSRMCQYLRSPRTAKFSTDSMLKQEEALAELDMSIDDWVNKLEQAENRRTRVRQKLLEHVAAAAILSTPAAAAASESLQLAMGLRSPSVGNISTPPRSPTKSAFSSHTVNSPPSPQRVVAQVPSTIIEQPLIEETLKTPASTKHETILSNRRTGMESIRIYADSDVYALLADVENEITKMSLAANLPENNAALSDDERKDIYRARSHEALSGLPTDVKSTVSSPRAPSPPAKDSPTDGGAFFLTNAVFRG